MTPTPKRDPRMLLGLFMGGGSLAAGAIRTKIFDGGIDWFFWSLVAVFVAGVGLAVWYVGRRRLHAQTRTFVERPARRPVAPHHEHDQ